MSKYGVRWDEKGRADRTVDNVEFASRREADRYRELRLLLNAGKISDLELQPAFRCEVNGTHICTYRADFKYVLDGKAVIEDSKGFATPVYRLKKKLVKALFDVDIVEV